MPEVIGFFEGAKMSYLELVVLSAAGFAVAAQGLWIWFKHYYALRPTESILVFFKTHRCEANAQTRHAYYVWLALILSINLAIWHAFEILKGGSVHAFWPRLLEFGLWWTVHQIFDLIIRARGRVT